MIVLIASTIYVIAWLIDYFFFIPDFMDKYATHMLDELKASGASQLEIDKQAEEIARFGKMYKNPDPIIFISFFMVCFGVKCTNAIKFLKIINQFRNRLIHLCFG